jgi:hypothetical protein
MKKTFLLFVFFLLGSLWGFSQVKIHVGLNTAYSATFVLDKGLQDDPRYNAQATYNFSPIGLSFGVDFSARFGVQLESILSNQGQIYEIIDVAQKQIGERKIDLQYINLPLMLRTMGGGEVTRFHFMLGPQLSLLTQASEIYSQRMGGNIEVPEGTQPPAGAVKNPDGTYYVPPQNVTIATVDKFRKANLQIAAALGVDFLLSEKIYISTQVRANYAITDSRNEDLINAVKTSSTKDLFGRRSEALVGIQIGVNYVFGR